VHGPRIQTGNSESHGDEMEDKQGKVYCIMCGSAYVNTFMMVHSVSHMVHDDYNQYSRGWQ
jgi:hypothetical protein